MKRHRRTPAEIEADKVKATEAKRLKAEAQVIAKRAKLDRINARRLEERITNFTNKALKSINFNTNTEIITAISLPRSIKPENRRRYTQAIFDKLITSNDNKKQLYLQQTARQLPLSEYNRENIYNILEGNAYDITRVSDDTVQFLKDEIIAQNKPLNIVIKPFIHKNVKRRGAFFPYYNKTYLDLTRYQITRGDTNEYTQNKNVNKYNCLYYALELLGVAPVKLKQIAKSVIGQKILLSAFPEIVKNTNITIVIHQIINGKHRETTFGDKNDTLKYNIALHSGHYFIYEKSQFTSYFINNYERLKNIDNSYTIYNDGNRRDQKRTISSLTLINLLVENKDKFLTDINNQNINKYDKAFNPKLLKDDFNSIDLNTLDIDDYVKQFETPDAEDIEDEEADEEPTGFEDIEDEEDEEAEEEPTGFKTRKKLVYKHVIYADFETVTDENGKCIPDMLIGAKYDKNNNLLGHFSYSKNNVHSKYNFISQFLNASITDDTIIYFHNAKFDYNFLIKEIKGTGEVENAGNFILHKGKFKRFNILIKDSYKIISAPLATFPQMFPNIKSHKEYINHQFYNKNDIYTKPFYTKAEFLEQFNNKSRKYKQTKKYTADIPNIVFKNCEELGFVTERINNESLTKEIVIDAFKYRQYYCELDVKILAEGMMTIRKDFKQHFKLDIYDFFTIPSIAFHILKTKGIFQNCYLVSGFVREFIEQSIVGGRVMTQSNEKTHKTGIIIDYDAVSLYPSAMARLLGFLKGKPKIIKPEDLNYNFLKNQDGYFIQIKITDIKIKRAFPLHSIKNEAGTRIFTNDIIGNVTIIDKEALEDLIKYHNIKFEIIKGFYYNDGYNDKIVTVIKDWFSKRKELQKVKNPAQQIYKLLMNSSYGKLIEKEHTTITKIITGKDKIATYISRNFTEIKNIYHYDDTEGKEKARITISAGARQHFTFAHLGVQVLSMSKRIMNEVISTAEDIGINPFYQDTDSIHLFKDDIPKLTDEYERKYNRKLEGKDLGQFHSDLNMEVPTPEGVKITEVYSTEFIGIDKKTYLHKIEGKDAEGNIYDGGYMTRSKGISQDALKSYIKTNKNILDERDVYKRLYNCDKITFDLCGDGEIAKFNINTKINTVVIKDEFLRTIHFPKFPKEGLIE